MTRTHTIPKSLILFVALPLLWACHEDVLGPDTYPPETPVFGDPEEGRLELMITPDQVDLEVGEVLELQHHWRDGEDTYRVPESMLRWVIEDSDVASVSDDGILRALAPGITGIRAEAEGASGQLLVRVRPS